jgi:hypothetical protein
MWLSEFWTFASMSSLSKIEFGLLMEVLAEADI